MGLTPFSIVGVWLRGLLAICIIVGAIWLLYEWQRLLPTGYVEVPFNNEPIQRDTVTVSLGFMDRVRLWGPGADWPTFALCAGVALLVASVSGKWIASPGWFRKPGVDEPTFERTGEVRNIKRDDGTVLRAELYGQTDGIPIVLTHGWTNDSCVWYYLKKQLGDRFRIIVWDLAGHGLSDKAKNDNYSVERFANDLHAVLDLAEGRPAILLGHSLGGMAVQMHCKLYPQDMQRRISSIILFATTYTNPLKTTKWSSIKLALQKPLVEPLLHLTIWLWPLVWLMNWLSYLNGSAHRSTDRTSFDGTETRGQLDFSTCYTVKAHPAVMAKGLLGMLKYDVTESLADIDIPALVVDCVDDEVILPEALDFIRSKLPNPMSASLTNSRHMGNLEQNQRFFQLVSGFSNAIDVKQASDNYTAIQTK